MPSNSFTVFAAATNVTRMLRAKLQSAPADSTELHAALEEIQTLWEELQSQADVLQGERERYSEFFEFVPDAYLITEPGGEIREANRAARELLSEAPEGASIVSFIPDTERPAFRGRLVTVRGQPEGEAAQWRGHVLRQDGTDLAVTFRVRPIKIRRKNADGLCWLVRPA